MKIKYFALIQSGGGTGPMKPGNWPKKFTLGAVLIPADETKFW